MLVGMKFPIEPFEVQLDMLHFGWPLKIECFVVRFDLQI